MNSKKLNEAYENKKEDFHNYLKNIKRNMKVDIFAIINPTLISNPYSTYFPKKFFLKDYTSQHNIYKFLKSSLKFYIKQFYFFISYLISFILYKIYYKKRKLQLEKYIGIDVFCLIDNINKNSKFEENYFVGLYDILKKYNKNYIFLPRLYGGNKKPFKLIKFFKIINHDKRNFLFEFELLSLKDFISIFLMILMYPFKTLRLLQKENAQQDILFNNELIQDIERVEFDAFSRYVFGKNITMLSNGINKIYSWSEFQVIERSFNYGVRTNRSEIKLYGCQFYLNYETYFNSYVYDIDFEQKTSFHDVLVNGKYYIQNREQVKYKNGVSFRYKDIFLYKFSSIGTSIILLGSYIEKDTKYMLDNLSFFENVLFKNHPAVNIDRLGKLNENVTVVNDNIYKLFKNASIVLGTASGTSVEAVACGVSVIIIASQDNLTANPLVEYGKGKIWNIAFTKDDVKRLYNQLTEYRKNNIEEIQNIASWYRENFFIEPTEENIVKAFELDKD